MEKCCLDCTCCLITNCPNKKRARIIHGVDVSECEFLEVFPRPYDPSCRLGLLSFEEGVVKNCKDCPDCYYKRLQRLRTDNKQLEARQLTKNGLMNQYLTAFEEIAKICKECKCFNNCEFDGTKECNYTCFWFGKSEIYKTILDKILKVLENAKQ